MPSFLGKVNKGETFTIQKGGVTVSVQFNDGSQTGYVDAGYMEWGRMIWWWTLQPKQCG